LYYIKITLQQDPELVVLVSDALAQLVPQSNELCCTHIDVMREVRSHEKSEERNVICYAKHSIAMRETRSVIAEICPVLDSHEHHNGSEISPGLCIANFPVLEPS